MRPSYLYNENFCIDILCQIGPRSHPNIAYDASNRYLANSQIGDTGKKWMELLRNLTGTSAAVLPGRHKSYAFETYGYLFFFERFPPPPPPPRSSYSRIYCSCAVMGPTMTFKSVMMYVNSSQRSVDASDHFQKGCVALEDITVRLRYLKPSLTLKNSEMTPYSSLTRANYWVLLWVHNLKF